MKTNYEIEVWQETVLWNKSKSDALVDYYGVWVDFGSQWVFLNGVAALVGKGVVIMSEDIDLKDCYLKIDDLRYEIVRIDKFYDRNKDFHHIEIVFK
jgi:hypothetical protein